LIGHFHIITFSFIFHVAQRGDSGGAKNAGLSPRKRLGSDGLEGAASPGRPVALVDANPTFWFGE